jgi:hypothetical protein
VFPQVVPSVTILLKALERTGGPEEQGVIGFKANLREEATRMLGDYEQDTFYVVSTLLDPRWKDLYYRHEDTPARAKQLAIRAVEAELEAGGEDLAAGRAASTSAAGSGEGTVQAEANNNTSSSIFATLKKRIRIERAEVNCIAFILCRPMCSAYLF